MTRLPKLASTSSWFQWLKRVWPQVPLGLLLFFIGFVNVLTGLQSRGLGPVYQILAQLVPLSELSHEVSLAILGSGVQVLLGGGMLVTGVGLFWRLRSAWAFSILLLCITMVVDLFSQRPIYGVLLPALALAALVIWQSRFSHRSLIGSYLMSLIGLLAVLAYGVFGSLLLGNRFQPSIHDLYTALYFTVVTLSTVGSNIYPATPEAQVFMITLILGGISIFTTTIVTALGPVVSGQINPMLSGKKVKTEPSDHVILVGASSFSSSVALELASHGIGFVQVVAPDDIPPLSEQPVVRGDLSDEVLKQAGILSAHTVVVAGEDDAANASTSLTAKNLNQNARVVVVASSAQAISRLRVARADLVFAPSVVGARLVTNLIRGVSIPRELQDLFEGS